MNEGAPPLRFFGTQPGGKTLDQGEGGGNPFASALIELLSRKELTLAGLAKELVELTERKSGGRQHPDVPPAASLESLRILPKPPLESRVALVLVFSDYSASVGATSLPGAAHDADRLTRALTLAGFDTQTNIDPKREQLGEILDGWAERSSAADLALLYTTGHGVEVDATIHLLPGDFPVLRGNAAIDEYAIPLHALSCNLRAKRTNLLFYAGCRDNPLV